jgi:hypothetical protein
MLFYALTSGYFVLYHFLNSAYSAFLLAIQNHSTNYTEAKDMVLGLTLLMFCIVLTKFTAYHVNLVMKNSTTIEFLENNHNYCYSLSLYRNFTQVFGKNPWMWWVPIYGRSGKPSGDGIIWPIVESQISESDVNVESEANRENSVKPMNVLNKNDIWPAERRSESPVVGRRVGSDVETDISFIRLNRNSPPKL